MRNQLLNHSLNPEPKPEDLKPEPNQVATTTTQATTHLRKNICPGGNVEFKIEHRRSHANNKTTTESDCWGW